MSTDPARRGEGAAGEPPSAVAGGLISRFSHSLRTPLNSILGYAQILALDRAEPLSAVQKERVERIQEAGWQLAKLIDDIVELARIEAGRAAPSARPAASDGAGPAASGATCDPVPGEASGGAP
jgi:signal transduction histidine kinase